MGVGMSVMVRIGGVEGIELFLTFFRGGGRGWKGSWELHTHSELKVRTNEVTLIDLRVGDVYRGYLH